MVAGAERNRRLSNSIKVAACMDRLPMMSRLLVVDQISGQSSAKCTSSLVLKLEKLLLVLALILTLVLKVELVLVVGKHV